MRTLSLGVVASPDSSANIFIFSLKDSCSGTGAGAARACASASRRARGSLRTDHVLFSHFGIRFLYTLLFE
ncbi:unnamed protein product [Euphydryas editha]|uniref:Uncharacterized protein n=1 Tax=Euphydryas editha TaxID=104508 RepID=A0AAU9V7X1_EUPED|nr:unnamed protein product [Euphydryas editha]